MQKRVEPDGQSPRREAPAKRSAGPSGIARTRDELEFLPAALEVLETPPKPAARLVTWLIVLFAVSGLAWSILGHVDVVVVANGQVIPTERVKLVQPIENGIIRAIHVRDGQTVGAGDPLIELDPTDSSANVESLRYEVVKARLDEAVYAALLTEQPEALFNPPEGTENNLVAAARNQISSDFQRLHASLHVIDAETEEQRALLDTATNQVKKANELLPFVADRLAGLEELEKQQLARKPELVAARQQHIDLKAEVVSATSAMYQAKSRILARQNKRTEIIASFTADILQKRSEALRRIATNEQQLKKEERKQSDRILRAPASGVVVGLAAYTIGGVVTTKDTLMKVVPTSSKLGVEAVVLNKDIGFVRKGQRAEVKLETFPFTRYGLVEAEVVEVWRDAVQDEKQGLVYKAELALKGERLKVDDRWVPLAPGMSVQAEINIGRRQIIDFFISPLLRYRSESLRER